MNDDTLPNEVSFHGNLMRVIDEVQYPMYAVITRNNFRAYQSMDAF